MKLLVSILVGVALTVPALADVDIVSVEMEVDQVPLVWTVVPDGSGPPSTEARRPDGSAWDRPIRLRPWFVVWGGPPDPVTIPHLPAEDTWLATADQGLAACPGGTHPDGPADADGWLSWSQPLLAGGGNESDEATLLVAYGVAGPEPIPLAFRSPDINGDLAVGLSDIVIFVALLAGQGETWRGDFNLDGVADLSDVVVFARAVGASCP